MRDSMRERLCGTEKGQETAYERERRERRESEKQRFREGVGAKLQDGETPKGKRLRLTLK